MRISHPRIANGLADRAIVAALSESAPQTTQALIRAASKRAGRRVHEVTVAQALQRLQQHGKIEKIAHGLWLPTHYHATRLARACMRKPIWLAVADVFDAKGDPFMHVEDLLRKIKHPADTVMKELRAMKRAGIVELAKYSHWSPGKSGNGVGVTPLYQRPDQLPRAEPQTLADLLS